MLYKALVWVSRAPLIRAAKVGPTQRALFPSPTLSPKPEEFLVKVKADQCIMRAWLTVAHQLRGWRWKKRGEVREPPEGGYPELLCDLSRVSLLHDCGGSIWKLGNPGPTGGRVRQRPHASRDGEPRLPGLTGSPNLCTAGAASHILSARHKAGSECLPAIPDRLPAENSAAQLAFVN